MLHQELMKLFNLDLLKQLSQSKECQLFSLGMNSLQLEFNIPCNFKVFQFILSEYVQLLEEFMQSVLLLRVFLGILSLYFRLGIFLNKEIEEQVRQLVSPELLIAKF